MQKLIALPVITGLIFLAGCNNQPATTTTTTEAVTQPSTTGSTADDHSGDLAKLEAIFPGATLTKKPLPLAKDAAVHLNNDIKMKFAGDEKSWEVYDASKDGKRVGMIMLTHATIPGRGGHHLVVAVDSKWKIAQVTGLEDLGSDFSKFVDQFKGKDFTASMKVGEDLKAVESYDKNAGQAVADTVRRASWIFNEYFNPNGAELAHQAGGSHSHGADTHVHADEPHDESKPHSHDEAPHDESKPHTHSNSDAPHDESKPHSH